MAESSSRRVVEEYARAFASGDVTQQNEWLHPDLVEEYPQSGERFEGRDARTEMLQHWPQDEMPTANMPTLLGSEDRWVLMPTFSPLRVIGSGDEYTGIGTVTYPNGETWHLLQLIRLRGGRIAHLTSYFAAPFEAPAWRAPYRSDRQVE
jgi:hypothetical protein